MGGTGGYRTHRGIAWRSGSSVSGLSGTNHDPPMPATALGPGERTGVDPRGSGCQDQLFRSDSLVPEGSVSDIRYAVYVCPERYGEIGDPSTLHEVGRVISRINQKLRGERFLLIGPGRWGSSNPQLGVPVRFSDFCHAAALVEIADGGIASDVSLGSHFYMDLVTAGIPSLPLYPERDQSHLNRKFFQESPSCLEEHLPRDASLGEVVRVIDMARVSGGRLIQLHLDAPRNHALAFLAGGG